MARTKQTARKSTCGFIPPRVAEHALLARNPDAYQDWRGRRAEEECQEQEEERREQQEEEEEEELNKIEWKQLVTKMMSKTLI